MVSLHHVTLITAGGFDFQSGGVTLEKNALAHNTVEYVNGITGPEDIGDVLLTGSTGFLGIHVLKYLVDSTQKTIFCLIRGEQEMLEKRLQNMLMYYFDGPMWELFGSRIRCVKGDITDPESLDALTAYDFKTVINCAAYSQYQAKGDNLEQVNHIGVENLIAFCLKTKRRLVQVSTVAVAGINVKHKFPEEKVLFENELDFGQHLEGKFFESKFKAEKAVLKAVEEQELDGKIIRVGSLMSRYSDGEFRANFVNNSFMRRLRAYGALGKVPVSILDQPVECSPVDCTAEAVVKLSATGSDFTVFHATNGHMVQMGDVIQAMRIIGLEIQVVDDDEFEQTLKDAKKDDKLKKIASPLLYFRSTGNKDADSIIGHSNRFTTKALYRLSFKWPIITDDYLANTFRILEKLDFFRE